MQVNHGVKRIGFALPIETYTNEGIWTLSLIQQIALLGVEPVVLNASGIFEIPPLQRNLVKPFLDKFQKNRTLIGNNIGRQLVLPVLHSLGEGGRLAHSFVSTPGTPDIGVASFSNLNISSESIERVSRLSLVIVTSNWHAQALRDREIKNVVSLPLSVDTSLFHPGPRRNIFANRFAIYCGRELSYQHGADIIIAAFKVFRQSHPEALMVCDWSFNHKSSSNASFLGASYLDIASKKNSETKDLIPWLEQNGIATDSVINLNGIARTDLAGVIRECDLAVFPARVTAGVAYESMEAMACGVPTVLSAHAGHLDLIGDHCYVLKTQTDLNDGSLAGWKESSVDELVAEMERAYQYREEALQKGVKSSQFIERWNNTNQIRRFLDAVLRAVRGETVPVPTANQDYHWGLCFHRAKRYEDAQKVYDRVIERAPDHIGARMDRAITRRELGDNDGAKSDFSFVINSNPNHPQAFQGLADTLRRDGEPEECIAYLQRALLVSDLPSLHWDLAWTLLLMGRYAEAWPHFEHRHAALGLRTPSADKPRWDGSSIAEGTLLVLDEQGLGDTLQFIRFLQYIPKEPNGRVIFAGKPATLSIVRRILPEQDVFDWEELLPYSNSWVPLMSLPKYLGVKVPEDIPIQRANKLIGYERIEKWRRIVQRGEYSKDERPVVALCWRGNPNFKEDSARSPGLEVLKPILAVSNVRFVSLQVGAGRKEIAELGLSSVIDDIGGLIESEGADVLDTLAVLESCDLVISSCTSMVHMAGISSQPCWVLLSTKSDWRWMLDREDSPWYPSLKLMRQQVQDNWSELADRVAQDLAKWSFSKEGDYR